MNINTLEKFRSNSFQLGTWLSMGSPVIAELAGLCGFDWLLIDLEHGAVGESALFQVLQALRGTPTAVIVRIGAPHSDLIQRVLDWGADGIMVPHVDTAEQAQAVVRASRFPPRGMRGYSRSVRACDYGFDLSGSSVDPLIFTQIESAQAVSNVYEIAAVDGVDVLFVGPADLNLDLKAFESSLSYEECLETVAKAAAVNGRQAGLLNRNDTEVEALKVKGFSVQAVDSDLSILRGRFKDLVARLTDHTI
ncbi:MAG: aldolase/citrate lyase family protein [Kiritimatiellae bacterium]|jgi:2-keto-3-deoxy-L-rhamnonate aldolase RhmA|nr:aldolase/citrate lyase family protein [Kiritimatiellia bacterium]